MSSPSLPAIISRLNRAEGQIRALKHLLEESRDEDCRTFITQIKAARAALKAASEQYILLHIGQCQHLPASERAEKVAEAVKLLASD